MKSAKWILCLVLLGLNLWANPIIPKPLHSEVRDGFFDLDKGFKLIPDKNEFTQRAVGFFRKELNRTRFSESPQAEQRVFFIHKPLKAEAYELVIGSDRITILSGGYSGAVYAIQSLLQLFPLRGSELKCVRIKDEPRFAWRSMMLDCSRQFFDVKTVKKFIDTMAFYKMNVFHWHLTDNEGWRLEVKKYPKLTELGAWRGANEILPPSRGSRKERYGGFYTQDEIKEIVAYALERNVNILPEVDIPGHCMAICGAYPETLCDADESQLTGIPKDSMCAGRDENFQILDDIFSEVASLFPFDTIHVGGDEVKKQRWSKCSRCAAKMQAEGLSEVDQLQNLFVRRVERIIKSKGKKMLAWNEVLKGGELSPDTQIMSWEGIEPGVEAIKRGHRVVMSPGPYMYFDMAQKSRERGHSWAGFINLEKVYSYEPLKSMKLNSAQEGLLYGVGACLWAEYLDKKDCVWHQTYPRLLALSEVSWSSVSSKNWKGFYERFMEHHTHLLNAREIAYRVSTPNLNLQKGVLSIDNLSKGSRVYFTKNKEGDDPAAELYKGAIQVDDPKSFAAVMTDPAGQTSAVTKLVDQEPVIDSKTIKPQVRLIAQRPTRVQNPSDLAEDWDRDTYVWFDTQCQKNETLTFEFTKPLKASRIECRSGVPKTIRSLVEFGVLEGSSDGVNFFKLADFIEGDAKAEIDKVSLKKVRIRFLEEQSEWTALQDLIIYP